jgi:hypothetical protein
MNCILLNPGHILEIICTDFPLHHMNWLQWTLKLLIVLHAALSCGGVCLDS